MMKRLVFVAALLAASPSYAETALEFAATGMGQGGIIHPLRPVARDRRHHAPRGESRLIASAVCAQIGCQWTSTALRIAKIESGFRCNARNGRAVGIFQNTNPQMFGVSRAAALTCGGGIRAGVAHMRMCIGKGARTSSQMMRCHNSGSPWGRVERAYRIALRGE